MSRSLPSPSDYHPVIADMLESGRSPGEIIPFKVISNSMSPALQIGDTALVEAASPDSYRLGDAILVRREYDYLTHRLIHKSGKKWLTKGDNNLSPDPTRPIEAVVGRVIRVQRGGQTIDMQTRFWQIINRLLANLSKLEWKAFTIHRFLRLPFRLTIKLIQKTIIREGKSHADS